MIAGVRIPLINSQLQLWLTITIPVWVGLNLFSIFLFEGVRTHKLKREYRTLFQYKVENNSYLHCAKLDL